MPLLTDEEREKLLHRMDFEELADPNTDPESRREILSTMEVCPLLPALAGAQPAAKMKKPIVLSAEQSAIIRGSVEAVHPRSRDRHLAAIHSLLKAAPCITNRVVIEACARATRAAMLGAGAAPELGDDN